MEKCIHPDCTCNGFKQPQSMKGTLLPLRTTCSECGHMLSDHRKLTEVDAIISKELSLAATKCCIHQIPVLDVPRSPVFGCYDPIHLPWGDLAQDCTVRCTCAGFITSDIVSVQQSFLRVTQLKAREDLPHLPCNFCQHPLSSHKGSDPASVSNGCSDVANLGRLKFRTLSQLNNLTGPCALTLDHKRRQFIFVCFRSLSELVVLSSKWDPEEKIKDSMETDQDVAMETVKQSNKSRPNSQKVRRSSRLEAKRRAFCENTKEVKPEVIVPMEAIKRFMKELGESSEWKKVGDLPTVHTDSICLGCLSTDNGLVLAVASQSGGWVVTVPSGGGEVVWSALKQNNYTCVSFVESPVDYLVAMGTINGEVVIWKVTINHMNTEQFLVLAELISCCQECSFQITSIQWAPNGNTLAVGCFHGDILLYSCGDNGLTLSQTMHVCGGSVVSLTWSDNSRMLAVGGSDDCVQVIVGPPPNESASLKQQALTILDFFPKLSGKFLHTLTLKGHQSFISDVHFTPSGLLLSLGWDGQLLVWSPSHNSHPHTVDSDPVGGFKIGPSMEVKFLPLIVASVDNGLLVVIRDKLSNLSVINYSLLA